MKGKYIIFLMLIIGLLSINTYGTFGGMLQADPSDIVYVDDDFYYGMPTTGEKYYGWNAYTTIQDAVNTGLRSFILPEDEIEMVVAHPGSNSYFNTGFSGIGSGYSVQDGATYQGYCVDEFNYIYPGTHYLTTMLYSVYDQNIDEIWPDMDWENVNWILNHKADYPTASKDDFQEAIWYFTYSDHNPATAMGQKIRDDAKTHGNNFVPSEGELVAVLCIVMKDTAEPPFEHPDDQAAIQRTLIEVPVPAADSDCYTIDIAEGSYQEQIIINKNVSLQGHEGSEPIIIPPSSLESFIIPEYSYPITPLIFAFGGTLNDHTVEGDGTISVSIDDVTIDCSGSSSMGSGVLFRNVMPNICIDQSGITGSSLESSSVADGVQICGDSDIILSGNIISSWDKGISVGFDDSDASTVLAFCNEISGNQFGMVSMGPVVQASCNYWGDCSGPSGEGPGVGDPVSENILFDPWIGDITADAGGPYSLEEQYTVHFNGSGSITPDCCTESVSYFWDFGDGNTSTEENPVHTYDSLGTYTITLTVTAENSVHTCSDINQTTVRLYNDPPLIQLQYPLGGETLSGIVTVQWYAIDNGYPGGVGIPIYLYYSANGGSSWKKIDGTFTNNIDIEHGSYDWNTNGLADGSSYILKAEVTDPVGNIDLSTTSLFTIDNGNAGIAISDLIIQDMTLNSDAWVKHGDDVTISAFITGNEADDLQPSEITVDLSGFGLENNVPAESYDGFIATWMLNDVICVPSDGPIQVVLTVRESTRTAVITADNTAPDVSILKPAGGLYLFGSRIFPFGNTIIVGALELIPDIIDAGEVASVEYSIDDVILETVMNAPWSYILNVKSMGGHTIQINVSDKAGNSAEHMVDAAIINPNGVDW